MTQKPRFTLIAGRPHETPAQEPAAETPLERARRRYGKLFGHERGTEFKWQSGASFLDNWMHGRRKP